MRKIAAAWACTSLIVCVLLLTVNIAASPDDQTPFPPLETTQCMIHRRWLFDQHSGQWKPISAGIPAPKRSAALGGLEESYDFPICDLASWQFNPVIALDSECDEFLVVWEDMRSGSNLDVYGQRLAGDGSLLGDEVALATGEHDQAAPALFYNPVEGGYLLIWHHRQQGKYAIYGQRLSALGTPLDAPFRVPSPDDRQQWIPGCAYNDVANEYLVVWEDMTTSDIFAQRIASDGTPLGDPITIATWLESQWTLPFVTFSSVQHEYLVIWDALASADIYGQILAADGTPRGENVAVSIAAGRQLASDVAYSNSSDEYLVLWTDERALAKRGSDVYAQRIAANGLLIGEEGVVSAAPDWQRDCVAVYDAIHGEYLLLWWDGRNPDTASDIYGRRLSAHGTPLGPDLAIAATASNQILPRLARREADDQYAIVWQDWHYMDGVEDDPDIRGLLYSPQRFILWFPQVVAQSPRSAFSNNSPAR